MNNDERVADAKFMAFAKRFKSQAKKVKVLSDDEDVTVVEDSKSSKKPLLSLPPLKPAKMYVPQALKGPQLLMLPWKLMIQYLW